MPVSGPDLRLARQRGKEIAKDILEILEKKHHISKPWYGHPFSSIPNDKSRMIAQIVNGIIELNVLDACESW